MVTSGMPPSAKWRVAMLLLPALLAPAWGSAVAAGADRPLLYRGPALELVSLGGSEIRYVSDPGTSTESYEFSHQGFLGIGTEVSWEFAPGLAPFVFATVLISPAAETMDFGTDVGGGLEGRLGLLEGTRLYLRTGAAREHLGGVRGTFAFIGAGVEQRIFRRLGFRASVQLQHHLGKVSEPAFCGFECQETLRYFSVSHEPVRLSFGWMFHLGRRVE